jgi:O-antigen/teichoic acid export membrane protein
LTKKPSLAQRTVSSISWNFIGNIAQIVIAFVRSVLLARMLPVEAFGIYAWAHSVTSLTSVLPDFGLGGAFLHRAPETKNEGDAAAVQFTLQIILTLIWAASLTAGALLFVRQQPRRIALVWTTAMAIGSYLSRTPRLILARRVVHRRLALVNLMDTVSATFVALLLAWQGATLWALLATDLTTLLVNVIGFYVWRPVWKPRVSWNPAAMRYFLSFGGRNVIGTALLRALDRLDDLWVGTFLGNAAAGLYSRAYQFAIYPRKILASPVNMVTSGTYAELKDNRKRLSQAFYRINALLVRSGFLIAGILALIAPEIIRLLLGRKWMPMLNAFRLMLVYTMFDPFKLTISSVFVAVGEPERIVWARAAQLAVMVVGLVILAPTLDIAGVALAVDAMLVVGIVILLWQVREHVDFSIPKLFGAPIVGLLLGLVLSRAAIDIPGIRGSNWRTGGTKLIVFLVTYALVLLALERKNVKLLVAYARPAYERLKDRLLKGGFDVRPKPKANQT